MIIVLFFRYCRQHYRRDDKNASQVFLMLLRMYANPPENSILGLMHSNLPKPHPNFSLALRVLKDYAAFIDTVKVRRIFLVKFDSIFWD